MLRQLRITVEGRSYDVTVEDLTDSVGGGLYPQPGSMTTAPPAETAAAVRPPASSQVSSGSDAGSPAGPAPAADKPAGGGDVAGVISPMTGVIVSLMVSVGSQVEDGDTVAVLEAMKMKTPLVSTISGTVVELPIAVGDTVEAGQTVLILG